MEPSTTYMAGQLKESIVEKDPFSVVREVFLDALEVQLASVEPWDRKRAMEIVDRFLETHLDEEVRNAALLPLYEEGVIYPVAFVVSPWSVGPRSDALVVDWDGAHRVSLHDYVEQMESDGYRFR